MKTEPSFAVRVLWIVWPAFLMAGAMEALVFAVVDPADLRWFGSESITWSHSATYSVTFLLFWLLISTASAISHLLSHVPEPSLFDPPTRSREG
jgi:hypothetical protein